MRSFRNGDLTTPLGSIARLQVKAFAPSGQLLFTTNDNNLAANPFTASYTGLVPGVTFQVQASVRGIDGRRTDVVTAAGVPVVRAPDLAVTGVTAPASALVGMPTVVSATVAELNGDLGARGDCVLYVDGAEADRAGGIWVDAGDVVSCAFTVTFHDRGEPRSGRAGGQRQPHGLQLEQQRCAGQRAGDRAEHVPDRPRG